MLSSVLMYGGRVLKGGKTLGQYKIEEGMTIYYMIKKPSKKSVCALALMGVIFFRVGGCRWAGCEGGGVSVAAARPKPTSSSNSKWKSETESERTGVVNKRELIGREKKEG